MFLIRNYCFVIAVLFSSSAFAMKSQEEVARERAVYNHLLRQRQAENQKKNKEDSLYTKLKTYPITSALVIANIGVFYAQMYYGAKTESPYLEDKFCFWNEGIKNGQWWRLGTSMFLHQGIMHLGHNTFSLITLRDAEKVFGSAKYLGLYMASGLLANIANLIFRKPSFTSLGASGAIFGILGAFCSKIIQRKQATYSDIAKSLAPPIVLETTLSTIGITSPVDHAAHAVGLLSGFGLARLFS